MKDILIPIAPGELIDKLTILQLKQEHISDPAKLENVRHEFGVLQEIADSVLPASDALQRLWKKLYRINADLWVIEDDIRAFEDRRDFGAGFVALARAVYVTNDERAAVKKEINLLLGSSLVEEKSYYSSSKSA